MASFSANHYYLKRLIAILFLLVLLFNFFGYRLMIRYMQEAQTAILATRVDANHYNEADLITIKTKLNLPYYTSSPEYERVYGSIEIEGILYEYVKRRIHQDTLELLCLPNKGKMHLQSAEQEFFKRSLDGVPGQHDKKASTFKLSLPDFCQDLQPFSLEPLLKLRNAYFCFNTPFLYADYSSKGEQPPEAMHHLS